MKILSNLFLSLGLAVLAFCVGCTGRTMLSVNAAGFSNASLVGGYSLSETGETLGTGSIKFVEVDAITFDGIGRLSGHGTMNANGSICASTVTGTYNVNADGSGSATLLQVPDAASAAGGCTTISFQLALIISDAGAELQFIEVSTGEVASGIARRQ
jgi:hypothetical protein